MKTAVVKCGGSVVDHLSEDFFQSMKEMEKDGYRLAFVHGGGPEISAMLDLFKIKSEFKNGLRITDEKVLETAELVLSGKTNRKLVHLLQQHGFQAIGLNSSDAYLLEADYINREEYGLVGDVTNVKADFLSSLTEQGLLPVLTPIASGPDGRILNVNADHAACAVAAALNADHFLMVTDVDGVYQNGRLIDRLTEEKAHQLMESGVITGGMIPKVQSALKAASQNTGHVHIVSGKKRFYKSGHWYGTQFAKEKVTI
ncbi:acetylglutamate kinase [Bacillus smithii]|uniref:acetylglutamate kinase n=1 Tax=Bacillus smithii TaxID=1479 RepID=UPI002E1B7AF2|nr:acetylglutamate kinase [Bacillus smithii]